MSQTKPPARREARALVSRRQALRSAGWVAALAALAYSRRAQAGLGNPEPGPDEAAKPSTRPARLLLVGDSMIAGGFGLYLAQDLERDHGVEVIRQGKSSTGLARPDFYDWIKTGQKLVDQHQPDAVACMFGGNDGQGLYMGRKAEPKWIRYNEPGWTPEYRRRVNAFADAVAPHQRCLLWIGMPPMRPTKLRARVEHMNTIFRAEMAIRPRAHFIDIWRALSDGEGGYTDHLTIDDQRVKVRAGDGVHMNRSGAHFLADYVQPEMVQHLHPVPIESESGPEPEPAAAQAEAPVDAEG